MNARLARWLTSLYPQAWRARYGNEFTEFLEEQPATLPAVLATPVMIMAMENAALEAIKPYFEAGESAVGTRVDVEHLAATPVGRRVVANAEVTGTDGRHIEFRVNASDGVEEIGRGTHGRVVVDIKKFAERLATKFAERSD